MIFADSGYFIGLWDPDDDQHDAAGKIEQMLRQNGTARGLQSLMTCTPMACEVAEHLSHTLGSVEGGRAYAKIVNNCQVVHPTIRDLQLGLDQTFKLYCDLPKRTRPPGMIDSIAVAVMRRTKILKIISFDRGFDLIPDIRRVCLDRGRATPALTGLT